MSVFNVLAYPKIIRPVAAVFLAVISLILSAAKKPTFPVGPMIDADKFELVWSDEFDGDSLDLTKWGGQGFANDETSVRRGGYWDMRMARVSGGVLRISTERSPEGLWYTCGIDTRGRYEQRYGYFETRCILPKGSGLWAAFWALCDGMGNVDGSGRDGAEIDIFESPNYSAGGYVRNSVTANLHYDGYGKDHRQRNICRPALVVNDPYEKFNTYGLEWNEKEYIIYVNGVEAGRSDFGGPSRVPEYLILSVEIGSEDGWTGIPGESWAGPSIETNPPEEITDFVVDYVRAYQYK